MANSYILNRGISILGVLFLGLIIILVLGYFHISIRAVVQNPQSQDNLNYVGETGRSVWNDYLSAPLTKFWNDVVIDIFWNAFINDMKRIRDGNSSSLTNSVPSVSY